MLKNSNTSYGSISVVLHWIMAVILIALFAAGLYMTDLDYYDALYHIVPWWHKSFGLLVFALFILRLTWKLINPKPASIATHQVWEKKAASISHLLLYLLIFIICASGYLISTSQGDGIEFFGWFDLPSILEISPDNTDLAGEVHFYLAWSLIILAATHAAAALKHHFIDRDDTLNNMILRKK